MGYKDVVIITKVYITITIKLKIHYYYINVFIYDGATINLRHVPSTSPTCHFYLSIDPERARQECVLKIERHLVGADQ